MKDIVINMDDFTDSREVMTARPHPFTLWLVYIILGIVTAFIVWASISQMDEYVKVRGTVRPVEDTASIKFPISGTIQSISVKDGQTVKKGDVLFEIDAAASKNQKATEEKQLNNIQTQINNAELLCNSIKIGKNQFDSSNESQKDYQSRYNDYLASVKSTKIQYESNSLDLAQTKQDAQQTISSANQSIEKNQKSLQDYKTLSASISSNLNKFTEDNSICSKKYASYHAKYQAYQQTLLNDQKKFDNANKLGQSQEALDALQAAINADKSSLETLKQDALVDAQTAQDQLNEQLNELSLSKAKAQNVLSGSASKQTGENVALEKLKLDTLSQLEDNLTTLHSNEATLRNQIFDLNQAINSSVVKANTDGKISLLSILRVGDLAAAGNEALSIVPQNTSKQMILYVPESDISHFTVNGTLKYQIDSLPYNEYGEAFGKILSVSPDVISDKTSGGNYYIVKGELDAKYLKNEKGVHGNIQTGMNCQAKMVYGSKSILNWICEKLNFIN